MRSFTTSGTVTDIVAQLTLQEGDRLIKEIADVVRRHETRLTQRLRHRHFEFLRSIEEEVARAIQGIFTVQVQPHKSLARS